MTAIVQTLNAKLKQWRPATARKVTRQVAAIIKDAEQAAQRSRPARPVGSRAAQDPFFSDQKCFTGRTPADLAANHDRYLYDT